MAIVKPAAPASPPNEQDAKAFIEGAPDGKKPKRRGIKRGKKEQIAVIISSDLLDQADQAAEKMSLSRSGLISMALKQLLQSGLKIKID